MLLGKLKESHTGIGSATGGWGYACYWESPRSPKESHTGIGSAIGRWGYACYWESPRSPILGLVVLLVGGAMHVTGEAQGVPYWGW